MTAHEYDGAVNDQIQHLADILRRRLDTCKANGEKEPGVYDSTSGCQVVMISVKEWLDWRERSQAYAEELAKSMEINHGG